MFNGIWLVAREPLTIDGRDIQPGERFEISRIHSGVLLVTGKTTIDKEQKKTLVPREPRRRGGRPRKPKPLPETSIPETPTPEPETESTEESETQRRSYRRRDLEAEE